MSLIASRRRGKVWEDANTLNQILQDFPFHTTGRKERDFVNGLSTALLTHKGRFNNKIITEIDKSTTVRSVYCFGKKHRPDLQIGEAEEPEVGLGISVEVKFVTYDGLKSAIGQGYIYRLVSKFVFLILVVSEEKKDLYYDVEAGKDLGLESILNHLAEEMNVFTYIVPAFEVSKPGKRKCVSFFK